MTEDDLSEDEREFLRGYRNSSPEQKKRIQQMAMRLATKRINDEFRNQQHQEHRDDKRSEAMNDDVKDVAQADKQFQELGLRIGQIKAALVALDRMNFMGPRGGGEDSDDAAYLLDRAREDARTADDLWNNCELAYGQLSYRLFNRPDPGDQLPPELIADLIRAAAEARDDKQWQMVAIELGDRLYQFALKDRRWMPLMDLWKKALWSRGVSTGLVAYGEGEQRLVPKVRSARRNKTSSESVDPEVGIQIMRVLGESYPFLMDEEFILRVITDMGLSVGANDIRRELQLLSASGLVNIADQESECWSAELTRKTLDIVRSL